MGPRIDHHVRQCFSVFLPFCPKMSFFEIPFLILWQKIKFSYLMMSDVKCQDVKNWHLMTFFKKNIIKDAFFNKKRFFIRFDIRQCPMSNVNLIQIWKQSTMTRWSKQQAVINFKGCIVWLNSYGVCGSFLKWKLNIKYNSCLCFNFGLDAFKFCFKLLEMRFWYSKM